jgi:hypothetical protein
MKAPHHLLMSKVLFCMFHFIYYIDITSGTVICTLKALFKTNNKKSSVLLPSAHRSKQSAPNVRDKNAKTPFELNLHCDIAFIVRNHFIT